MYNLLVPVDTDVSRALHQAKYVVHLSKTTGDVEATVLHVTPEWRNRRFTENDAAVEAAEYIENEDISVNRALEEGGVSHQIIQSAEELTAQEIVMGGRKRSGVAMVVLGSTVQDVTLSAERPVTITGKSDVAGTDRQRVLVPVDTDEQRARHQADYVAQLPNAPETIEATVLYVYPRHTTRGFSENEAAETTAATLESAGVSVERVATSGKVPQQIISQAHELNVDKVVMGGRKRSAVQKVVMGSISLDIILTADRPVTITG